MTAVITAVGIELDDTVTTLDGVVDGVLGSDMAGAELNMTAQAPADLLAMDTPVTALVFTSAQTLMVMAFVIRMISV